MNLARRIRLLLSFSVLAVFLLLTAVVSAASRATTASDDGAWRPLPPQFYGAHGVFDPARQRMIVIGTKVFALSLTGDPTWSEISVTGTPAFLDIAIYDVVRDRVVVFGGQFQKQTWALSLSGAPVWSQLPTTGSPPDDVTAAFYDPARDRMVVFKNMNEVFALTLANNTWTQLTTTGTPVDRLYFSAIYDPKRDRAVIFGGENDDFPGPTDVWALSLSGTPAWTDITPAGTSPGDHAGHSAIYDSLRDRMVIFAGSNSFEFSNHDTWALSFSGTPGWTLLNPGGSPPQSRGGASAIYDEFRDQMVIYGGDNFRTRDDFLLDARALQFASNVWVPLVAPPSQRARHAAIYDPVRDRMVVFGGSGKHQGNNDGAETPALMLGSERWVPLVATGGPDPRSGFAAVYDAPRDRMLVLAADTLATASKTWAFSLASPAWSNISAAGPSPEGGTAIYDAVRDRVIVFGDDLWALSLSGTPAWSKISTSGNKPAPRARHSAIYDPVRDRMIIFGGVADRFDMNDVWGLSLSGTPAWVDLTPAGLSPDPRHDHSAVYDPLRDRMVVYAGWEKRTDVWALALSGTPAWTMLAPGGDDQPTGRSGHTAIYDPVRDRMVVFGGEDFYSDFNDTWTLEWGSPPDHTPPTITVELNHNLLWPPNHKLVDVCASVHVTDNADPAPTFKLVSITVLDGKHAVNAGDDVQGAALGTADLCYDLRATRQGNGIGREYQIVYEASDASQNTARATVSVRIPSGGSLHAETLSATQLASIQPNPFNPETTVHYRLDSPQRVMIDVFDVRGVRVRSLVDESQSTGEHQVTWNGADDAGQPASSGLYFVRMTAGSYTETRKIVMLK